MCRFTIAFVSSGTFCHMDSYLRFFSQQGHDVHWITYTRPKDVPGVTIHDVSRGISSKMHRLAKWRYLTRIPKIRAILRQIQPDILHGHYVTSAGIVCLFSGFRPYIISGRGSDLIASMSSPLWRFMLRRVFAKANVVHTVSTHLAELASELGAGSKTVVFTQGVDTKEFAYRPPEPFRSPVRLLCTRTLAELYDPGTIVLACELLRQRGCTFTMTLAAGGVMQAQVEQLVREKRLQDHVRFLGGYNNRELPGLLREHDLYISATHWDGTSISLLEAMATGIVPIVSRIKSNEAWVEDGKTARMFDCGDADGLARQIERAIADPEWGRQAATINRHSVETRADRTVNMLRLEQLYCDVLGMNHDDREGHCRQRGQS